MFLVKNSMQYIISRNGKITTFKLQNNSIIEEIKGGNGTVEALSPDLPRICSTQLQKRGYALGTALLT